MLLQRILLEIMKIILETSDVWSMSHSSQQPSQSVFYIKDCRISGQNFFAQADCRKQARLCTM